MSTAIAVIGAGYGDESKGLATAYLARKLTKHGVPPLVARGNGGAQAGHTVVDGSRRHVFSHVSAGTFAGSPTYLSANFIVNPILLSEELLKLKALDVRPPIYANPSCRVTTIYDMALNSLAELARGDARHGSCGMGINETITRCEAGYPLDLGMVKLKSSLQLATVLKQIKEEWVPQRLKQHGITESTFSDRSIVVQQRAHIYLSMFNLDRLDLVNTLQRYAGMISMAEPEVNNGTLIIEGAQGLLLDEHLGQYPHVTRSITGLPSAIQAAHELDKHELQPIYVTRAYATRHGAGPLAYEGIEITDTPLTDVTNVTNEWQGKFRFAPLNVPLMRATIEKDRYRGQLLATALDVQIKKPKVFLSCLDQLGTSVAVVNEKGLERVKTCDFAQYLEDKLDLKIGWISTGPAVSDVEEVENAN